MRKTTALGITTMLWDNGLDNLARESGTWRDRIAVDIITNTVRVVNNSLADSTVDASTTSQTSSAYIFNKVGSDVTNQTLPFMLNGNSFKSLSMGGVALRNGEDYVVFRSSLIFKEAFLKNYLSASATPGTKANVTVEFSAGANSQVELVQWDAPTLESYSSAAADAPAESDLRISIVWKGLYKVAAAKITISDGAYLVDDWTNQWNFDFDHFIINRAGTDAVIAAGKNTTFTIEFYPHVAGNGNSVDYVLTVNTFLKTG
ncbi:carbohydrate binding domain X2-domain-containing protein [Lasiosphaeria ovina]|uniref:Carbohydrate binding domain X2-domain-containing protein n=1 Tax=Lasiosphaeria ovina TaxID=92902 RepID=A0AAE0N299_9PEZI|nr:carbohydrate binding domain X2-domain-containing protein [Lasiosphaeria ovina]